MVRWLLSYWGLQITEETNGCITLTYPGPLGGELKWLHTMGTFAAPHTKPHIAHHANVVPGSPQTLPLPQGLFLCWQSHFLEHNTVMHRRQAVLLLWRQR